MQGYAHEAAVGAARLLTAYGRPGADRWLEFAEALATRFRDRFWVEDAAGPFPAMALDGAKRPVDSLTSNIGHLLGSGLLAADEAALVAGRLAGDDLDAGFGLRTMSAAAGGYAPLSYHCGSVWPHDTAIVALGLAREGFAEQAAGLALGLVDAAGSFGWRLPELYAGSAAGGAGPAGAISGRLSPAGLGGRGRSGRAPGAARHLRTDPGRAGRVTAQPVSGGRVGGVGAGRPRGSRASAWSIDRDGLVVRQELSPA